MDLLLKRYRKSVSPRRSSEYLLDHSDQFDGKVFDILHPPNLYHGDLNRCHCHGQYFAHSGVRVAADRG